MIDFPFPESIRVVRIVLNDNAIALIDSFPCARLVGSLVATKIQDFALSNG
jgi:hypothetical protein